MSQASALNPMHPTTRATEGQWHKIAAILVAKLTEATGKPEVIITMPDLMTIEDMAIVAHDQHDGLHLYIETMEGAQELARKNPR